MDEADPGETHATRPQRYPLDTLRTGAPWKDLPERYRPYQTCHRRFQKWMEQGVLGSVLEALAQDTQEGAGRSLKVLHRQHDCCSQRRGTRVGKLSEARVRKSRHCQRRLFYSSPPPHRESALSHDELTLIQPTLVSVFLRERQPERLVGDKTHDTDPLDALAGEGRLEMIAPHRKNRKRRKLQHGRKLHSYKRRWKVERVFA